MCHTGVPTTYTRLHLAQTCTCLGVPYPEGGRKHLPKPTAPSCPMQPLSPGRQIWGPLPGVLIISRSQHWSVDRAARHPPHTHTHSPGTVRSPVSCPPLDFRNLPSLAIYSLSKSGALDWTRWGRAGGPRQGQEVLSLAGEGPRSPLHLWIMGTRSPLVSPGFTISSSPHQPCPALAKQETQKLGGQVHQ